MACTGVIHRYDIKTEYDRENDAYYVFETVIKQHVGNNARINAEAEAANIFIGFYSAVSFPPAFTTELYSVIASKSLVCEHERSATLTYTIKGKFAGSFSTNAYVSSVSSGMCINDKDIKKVPLGDTIIVDLGMHYKEVNYVVIGTDYSAVETLLRSCSTGEIIKGQIVENKLENNFIGTVLFYENCI